MVEAALPPPPPTVTLKQCNRCTQRLCPTRSTFEAPPANVLDKILYQAAMSERSTAVPSSSTALIVWRENVLLV
jgi:hypothetical protein